MSPISARRFMLFVRRTSPLDRIAVVLIAFYAVARILRAFGLVIPHSAFLALLAFAAVIYFLVRLIPWFRRRVLWSLRKRLIVAYLFMAIVPIMLLVLMIGVATYLFYLQLGAQLLNHPVEQRSNVIDTDAETIAPAIERQASH